MAFPLVERAGQAQWCSPVLRESKTVCEGAEKGCHSTPTHMGDICHHQDSSPKCPASVEKHIFQFHGGSSLCDAAETICFHETQLHLKKSVYK